MRDGSYMAESSQVIAGHSIEKNILRCGLIIFAFTAPLGNGTIGFAVLLLLSPLLLRQLRQSASPGEALLGPLTLPTAAFILAACITALFGSNIQDGLLHTTGLAVMAWVGLLIGAMVVQDRRFTQRYVVPTMIVSTAVAAAYGLIQYFILDVRRTTAMLSYTNRFATLLVFFGVLGVAYFVSRRNKYVRMMAVPYFILCMAALGTTLSRAGWLAAIAALGLAAWRWKYTPRVLVIGIVLVVGLAVAAPDSWQDRFQSMYSVSDNMDRITLWQTALNIFQHHPLTGSGPGSFLHIGPEYATHQDTFRPHATPHNVILSVASDMGIFGLAAFLWIIAKLAKMSSFLWRTKNAFTHGVVIAVAAILINDLFGQGFYTVQIGSVMWFGFGLLAALYAHEQRAVQKPQ